jgi:hypothetical protein
MAQFVLMRCENRYLYPGIKTPYRRTAQTAHPGKTRIPVFKPRSTTTKNTEPIENKAARVRHPQQLLSRGEELLTSPLTCAREVFLSTF